MIRATKRDPLSESQSRPVLAQVPLLSLLPRHPALSALLRPPLVPSWALSALSGPLAGTLVLAGNLGVRKTGKVGVEYTGEEEEGRGGCARVAGAEPSKDIGGGASEWGDCRTRCVGTQRCCKVTLLRPRHQTFSLPALMA